MVAQGHSCGGHNFALRHFLNSKAAGGIMDSVVSALKGYTTLRVRPLNPQHLQQKLEQEQKVRIDSDVESMEDHQEEKVPA